MTFDEFKELAANPSYIDYRFVTYRIDVHRYAQRPDMETLDRTAYEVSLAQSFMYANREQVQNWLPRFIHKEYLNRWMYALYVYQLPIHRDVSCGLYQRLWTYDRSGNLNAQTVCTALTEETCHPSSSFRGRDAGSIRFKPGDIVEAYDRDKNQVRLGVVAKQPPTIEQCWEMRKEVEKACIAEGLGIEETDDNYWLYACDDCYEVAFENNETRSVQTWDVFTPLIPVSASISDRLNAVFDNTKKEREAECSYMKITEATTRDRIQHLRRLVELL